MNVKPHVRSPYFDTVSSITDEQSQTLHGVDLLTPAPSTEYNFTPVRSNHSPMGVPIPHSYGLLRLSFVMRMLGVPVAKVTFLFRVLFDSLVKLREDCGKILIYFAVNTDFVSNNTFIKTHLMFENAATFLQVEFFTNF